MIFYSQSTEEVSNIIVDLMKKLEKSQLNGEGNNFLETEFNEIN